MQDFGFYTFKFWTLNTILIFSCGFKPFIKSRATVREMESASKIFQCLLAKFNTVVESDFVTVEIS